MISHGCSALAHCSCCIFQNACMCACPKTIPEREPSSEGFFYFPIQRATWVLHSKKGVMGNDTDLRVWMVPRLRVTWLRNGIQETDQRIIRFTCGTKMNICRAPFLCLGGGSGSGSIACLLLILPMRRHDKEGCSQKLNAVFVSNVGSIHCALVHPAAHHGTLPHCLP